MIEILKVQIRKKLYRSKSEYSKYIQNSDKELFCSVSKTKK